MSPTVRALARRLALPLLVSLALWALIIWLIIHAPLALAVIVAILGTAAALVVDARRRRDGAR